MFWCSCCCYVSILSLVTINYCHCIQQIRNVCGGFVVATKDTPQFLTSHHLQTVSLCFLSNCSPRLVLWSSGWWATWLRVVQWTRPVMAVLLQPVAMPVAGKQHWQCSRQWVAWQWNQITLQKSSKYPKKINHQTSQSWFSRYLRVWHPKTKGKPILLMFVSGCLGSA